MTFVRNHLLSFAIVLLVVGLVKSQGLDSLQQVRERQVIAAQKLKAELKANYDDAMGAKLANNFDKARELLRRNRILLEDDTITLPKRERDAELEKVNVEIARMNDRVAAAKEAERIAVLKGSEVRAFDAKLKADADKALAMANPSPSAVIASQQAAFKLKIQQQLIAQQQYAQAMQNAYKQQQQQPGYWTGPKVVDKTAPPAKDIAIMKALLSTTKIDINGQPMQEVLSGLEDKTRGILNFIVDEDALKDKMVDPKEFYNDPVTKKFRQPMKVRTFLKMILTERKMGYYIEDGVVMISTADKAMSKMVVKTYPVSNLVGGDQLIKMAVMELQFTKNIGPNGTILGQNIDGLTAQVMGSVEPDYWKVSGNGPGSMTFVPGSGSLAIRASLEVHYLLMASGLLDNTPKR